MKELPRFHLFVNLAEGTVCLGGVDDYGRHFALTLDRVWAMNLVCELEDWLCGAYT